MFAKKEIAEARMKICKSCEHFTPGMSMCMLCHCIMPLKTKLANISCPIDKWHIAKDSEIILEDLDDENCCPPDDTPIIFHPPGNN